MPSAMNENAAALEGGSTEPVKRLQERISEARKSWEVEHEMRIRAEKQVRQLQAAMASLTCAPSRIKPSAHSKEDMDGTRLITPSMEESIADSAAVTAVAQQLPGLHDLSMDPELAADVLQQLPGQGRDARQAVFHPIGYLESVFTTRNGTPRQPLLVPAALSRLVLLPEVPEASLEGLEAWSHIWVIYVFHDNTQPLHKAGQTLGVKGKVKVPRLNGKKVGLFATRTPHRPNPIGLSLAQVVSVSVDRRCVVLAGADIVDGSPVLDIKPFVPFADSVRGAVAPPYVQAEAEEEPLAVAQVQMTPLAAAQLAACWQLNRHRSLYKTADAYLELVRQVLSRDFRSLRQRLDAGPAARARNAASLASAQQQGATEPTEQPDETEENHTHQQGDGKPNMEASPVGVFHVMLEGVDCSYDVDASGVVIVGGASLTSNLAQQHQHKHMRGHVPGSNRREQGSGMHTLRVEQ